MDKKLGIFDLAMMSVVGIFTIRTLPLIASYGLSAVFYYLLGALVYFIPCSFMCAELATGWPQTGGMYIWVREAFGRRLGFLAIWLEWTNTVISFPTTLSFIVAMLAYSINPALASNKYCIVSLILIIFWSMTFINFLGIKFSSWMSNIGLFLGTFLPCLLIIGLSLEWILTHHPVQMDLSYSNLLPAFHWKQSAFLVGLLFGYAGMQITAFHAQETKNPQHDYPRAIFIAVLIILLLSVFGTLAISAVVSPSDMSIVTGLIQATDVFFSQFHLHYFVPVFAILIAVGTLAMLNMWVIGPCKGLLATARYGDLPPIMQHTNKHQVPTILLIMQAIVTTIICLVYLLMPNVSSSYWILIALASILTLMMNILMFAALLYLRYSQPEIPRAYKIPGGKIGVWLVSGIGIIVCIISFFIGFIPPMQLKTGNILFYEGFLILGVLLICSVPFILPRLKREME